MIDWERIFVIGIGGKCQRIKKKVGRLSKETTNNSFLKSQRIESNKIIGNKSEENRK